MKKILLVDDDKAVVESVKFLLETEGYNVVTAKDGEEGLAKAKSENPDLILLDILMPKINGYQMALSLNKDSKLKKIPVVLLTATAQVAGSIKLQTTARYKISKPFSADELLGTIKKALK
ncbi:MAG: response regulator [Candidatus Margulisbacteria bacterium]|nr:response regulator [Candidatus Margulisiibacteriota bacterium]